MLLRHLALAVQDEQRSREFYERWFGFGVAPPHRYPDGVLMLYGPDDVALALVEFCDEPRYVSVKCRDPDGYVIETSWET